MNGCSFSCGGFDPSASGGGGSKSVSVEHPTRINGAPPGSRELKKLFRADQWVEKKQPELELG